MTLKGVEVRLLGCYSVGMLGVVVRVEGRFGCPPIFWVYRIMHDGISSPGPLRTFLASTVNLPISSGLVLVILPPQRRVEDNG